MKLKPSPNPGTLHAALQELFRLAAEIDAIEHCGEVMAFTAARKQRPDAYQLVIQSTAEELAAAFDRMEKEHEGQGTQAAA